MIVDTDELIDLGIAKRRLEIEIKKVRSHLWVLRAIILALCLASFGMYLTYEKSLNQKDRTIQILNKQLENEK